MHREGRTAVCSPDQERHQHGGGGSHGHGTRQQLGVLHQQQQALPLGAGADGGQRRQRGGRKLLQRGQSITMLIAVVVVPQSAA